MKENIKKTWQLSLIKTLIFNFKYLPFHQAIKLPILLFKVKFKALQGQIKIDADNISFGMIKLGQKMNSLYENSNSRFIWENKGTVIFKGKCAVGHNSSLSIGKNGTLEFGDNFVAGTVLRIACYKKIIFGNNTRIAWEVSIIDTDFHATISVANGERSITCKEIIIGHNNWIGIRSLVLKGTKTPNFCVVGAGSLLNKVYDIPEYSLLTGNPAKLIKTGIYRDLTSHVV